MPTGNPHPEPKGLELPLNDRQLSLLLLLCDWYRDGIRLVFGQIPIV
jgi:hypothetical protein